MNLHALEDQHGDDCADLLHQVGGLASDTWQQAYDAFDEIRFRLVGAAPCPATRPALDLVLSELQRTPHRFGFLAVTLVAELAGGPSLHSWLGRSRGDASPAAESALVVVANASAAHGDARTRAAAALLVGSATPVLVSCAKVHRSLLADSDPFVRASALLATSRAGASSEVDRILTVARREGTPVERGAAELAWSARSGAVPEAVNLRHWLSWTNPLGRARVMPWFFEGKPRPYTRPDGRRRDNPPGLTRSPQANAVVALAQVLEAADAVCDRVAALPCGVEDRVLRVNAEAVVAELCGLADGPKRAAAKAPSALDPRQRDVVALMGDSSLFPHGGYGLVAAGGVRRRWLGAESPRVAERLVEHEPLWSWARRTRGSNALPASMFAAYSASECLEVVLLLDTGAYGPRRRGAYPELHRPQDGNHIGPLRSVIEEVVERMRAENSALVDRAFELVVLPWIRSGERMPESWAYLVPPKHAALGEALDAVSAGARTRTFKIILSSLDVSDGMDVLEKYPDPDVASWLWERLDELEDTSPTVEETHVEAWRVRLKKMVADVDALAGASLPVRSSGVLSPLVLSSSASLPPREPPTSNVAHFIQFDEVKAESRPPVAFLVQMSNVRFDEVAGDASIGDVVPIDCHPSRSARLDPLLGGGALFVVTVRPGNRLWRVGVLHDPLRKGGVWKGAANNRPIVDITDHIGELVLHSGHGLAVRPGKLASALRFPKRLAPDDVERLTRASG